MFISVKEAMELTGMSSTTIYRLCNKRINTLYVRKEDNKFLIDKEFILATFPPDIVAINPDVEPVHYNSNVQPANKMIRVEEPEKDKMLFIIENDEVSDPEFEVIRNSAAPIKSVHTVFDDKQEILQPNTEYQNTEILEEIGENIVSTQTEPLQMPETKKAKAFNWEALIGISVSLMVVGLLIYLVYLDVR